MSNPLHVAHAVLALDVGGLERLVIDLVRQGQRLGQRVSVLCLERPGSLASQVADLGAHLICIGKRPGLQLRSDARLRSAIQELHLDVLHTHQVGALYYAGPVARSVGVPLIVHTEHSNNIANAASGYIRRQRMSWLWWWAARHTRKFFCVSADIATELGKRRIVPQQKLEVLLNGINTAPFHEPMDRAEIRRSLGILPDAPVIGTVGRLNEVKRQDVLLRAFAQLKATLPAAQLLLVGDGPMRGELETLAKQLGVDSAVHFAGFQTQPERFLAVMDVFALTSRIEGLPLSILEAWAARLPVVASAVGGIPALIENGKTGLLFPSGDEQTLSRLLSELLADRDRSNALGQAGYNQVMEQYDLQRMATDYQRHYFELLGRSSKPSRLVPEYVS